MLDTLLDLSIYYSFDQSGFGRHKKIFTDETWRQGKGLFALVTGTSSGIGLALAKKLLENDVSVWLTFRDKTKAMQVTESLKKEFPNSSINFQIFDLSHPNEIPDIPQSFDIVVHNAGGMPLDKITICEKYEAIFSTHVIGPYILTKKLIDQGKLNNQARVIFVSSGGMYLKALDLTNLACQNTKYNPYSAYANAKRAQVDLTDLFAVHYKNRFLFSAMHPGWVNTPGVEYSMPGFWKFMQKRLRSPSEGADTILWLAMTKNIYPSGKFWFDRRENSPNWLPFTKTSKEKKQALWNLCEEEYRKYSQ